MSGVEDRLDLALEGGAAAPDPELAELLDVAGRLRESLVTVPAPDAFRRELGEWLARPQPEPWWSSVTGPVRRRLPEPSRPAAAAALGLGAAALVGLGVVAIRRRQAAGRR